MKNVVSLRCELLSTNAYIQGVNELLEKQVISQTLRT